MSTDVKTQPQLVARAASGHHRDDGALFPQTVRRWVAAGFALLLMAATYLISVRGTAILFDLRDAVSAMCF